MITTTTNPIADCKKSGPYTRWFYLFLSVHLLVWTLVPTLVRFNLPLDSMEGTMWGHQLEWGYDKNPFFYAWLASLAGHLDLNGHADGIVYLFSQLSVASCFIAIWQLAKKMLSPVYALIAIMVLEGVQYYHLHAIDFSDNTVELGLWAWALFCFYQALKTASHRMWMLTGLFAGLSMMTKYYTAMLLIGMVLFFFVRAENRKHWKTLPPYLCILVFACIIAPHLVWLFHHEFITVQYAYRRGSTVLGPSSHIFYAAQFAWQQLQAFLPAIVLYGLLFIGKRPLVAATPLKIDRFDRSFLLFVGLGPLVYTLLISILLGTKLRSGWGMPLLSTCGILMVALVQPRLTQQRLRQFFLGVFFFMGTLLTLYSIALVFSTTPSTANFAGKELAKAITQEWHQTYHRKLEYVAGSRWLCGNISLYSSDHPAVLIEGDIQKAPWINIADMRKKGAVFVWDENIEEDKIVWASLQKAFFPLLQAHTQTLELPWHNGPARLGLKVGPTFAPTEVGTAVLPPKA